MIRGEKELQIISDIKEMQALCHKKKIRGCSVGCVPTMGYFHLGHLSLMVASVAENDFTVVSLFVNPTQFGENEDFDVYPRDIDRDKEVAAAVGVDALFVPDAKDMYPEDFATYVDVYGLTEVMCGSARPEHFKGVTTVVSKLFNIIAPDRAYFGQKDIQQAVVVKHMVLDLNFPLEVRVMPVLREEDGLAMSSRNVYLSPQERKAALVLPNSLKATKALLEIGERDALNLRKKIQEIMASEPLARVDYVVVKDLDTLQDVDTVKSRVVIAAAVWIGKTRLIDNFIW